MLKDGDPSTALPFKPSSTRPGRHPSWTGRWLECLAPPRNPRAPRSQVSGGQRGERQKKSQVRYISWVGCSGHLGSTDGWLHTRACICCAYGLVICLSVLLCLADTFKVPQGTGTHGIRPGARQQLLLCAFALKIVSSNAILCGGKCVGHPWCLMSHESQLI